MTKTELLLSLGKERRKWRRELTTEFVRGIIWGLTIATCLIREEL